MEQWEKEYDVVIVDSPSILDVSATLLLASWLDAVIIVTRYNRTPLRMLSRVRDLLNRADALSVGFVINEVASGGANYVGHK